MQRDLEEVAEALFGGGMLSRSPLADVTVPALDVVDCGNEVVLRADLPGMAKDDIDIEVQDGHLTLRGERKDEHEEHGDDYHRVERWEGSFVRTVPIPAGVDPNQISAQMDKGILEVHMPKRAEAAPQRIEIKGEIAKPTTSSGSGQSGSERTAQQTGQQPPQQTGKGSPRPK